MRALRLRILSGLLTSVFVLGHPLEAHAQSSFSDEQEQPAPGPTPATPPAPRLTPRLRPRPAPPVAPPPARAPATPPPSSAAGPLVSPPPAIEAAPTSAFSPPLLPAYKDLPPPPGYIERRSWNAALLGGGGFVLLATYAASLGYGSSQNFENGLGALALPVFGPWIALGKRDFNCDVEAASGVDDIADSQDSLESCVAVQTTAAGFLVGLGVGQLLGAALLTVGILDSRRSWVRADVAGIDVQFDLSATPGLAGVSASGQF